MRDHEPPKISFIYYLWAHNGERSCFFMEFRITYFLHILNIELCMRKDGVVHFSRTCVRNELQATNMAYVLVLLP